MLWSGCGLNSGQYPRNGTLTFHRAQPVTLSPQQSSRSMGSHFSAAGGSTYWPYGVVLRTRSAFIAPRLSTKPGPPFANHVLMSCFTSCLPGDGEHLGRVHRARHRHQHLGYQAPWLGVGVGLRKRRGHRPPDHRSGRTRRRMGPDRSRPVRNPHG